ncbi:MAG: ferritin-like domain-containing protein [Mariprofundaceae bacterium]
MENLFEYVRDAFLTTDVDEKLKKTRSTASAFRNGKLAMGDFGEPALVEAPGRPERPTLVRAKHVPKRGFGTEAGRAIMMHAIAHIEFNAINLALDAVQRFPDMPEQFYADWLRIAGEEAYHFELIRSHMRHLGADYGDYDAHNGLWEMCEKTAHDVLIRMALVPRVLEARGLDVTPGIQKKLTQVGDHNAVSLLDIILRDEIGHVEIGNRWFRYCCKERGLKTDETFFKLLDEYYPKGLMGPFNLGAREQAGFSKKEIEMLTGRDS